MREITTNVGELLLKDTPGEDILSLLDDTTDWMETALAVKIVELFSSVRALLSGPGEDPGQLFCGI